MSNVFKIGPKIDEGSNFKFLVFKRSFNQITIFYIYIFIYLFIYILSGDSLLYYNKVFNYQKQIAMFPISYKNVISYFMYLHCALK